MSSSQYIIISGSIRDLHLTAAHHLQWHADMLNVQVAVSSQPLELNNAIIRLPSKLTSIIVLELMGGIASGLEAVLLNEIKVEIFQQEKLLLNV